MKTEKIRKVYIAVETITYEVYADNMKQARWVAERKSEEHVPLEKRIPSPSENIFINLIDTGMLKTVVEDD